MDLVGKFRNPLKRPNMIADSAFHRRSYSQGLVNPPEVVMHEVQTNGALKVEHLFAESVGQPGEAVHAHAHGQILALGMRG